MEYGQLIDLWTNAFNMLYQKDIVLFDNDAQERTIAGRLAMYLQFKYDPHFEKDECIDLEYNREGDDIKRPYPTNEDGWIAPDILLHVRRKNINIFNCEVKKDSNSNNNDSDRVKNSIKDRHYQYGLNLYALNKDCAKLTIYTQADGCVKGRNYVYTPIDKKLQPVGRVQCWNRNDQRKWYVLKTN